MSTRPDLEGRRLKHIGGQGPIYLVVDGILRHVTDQYTMDMFRDPGTETIDLSNIKGFNTQNPNAGLYPLPSTLLFIHKDFPQPREDPEENPFDVYMMDYNDIVNNDTKFVKRHVKSPRAMNAYNFRMPDYTKELPHVIFYAIPEGPPLPHP
jgi:hypothetical protein